MLIAQLKATPLLGYCIESFRCALISLMLTAEQIPAVERVVCTPYGNLRNKRPALRTSERNGSRPVFATYLERFIQIHKILKANIK